MKLNKDSWHWNFAVMSDKWLKYESQVSLCSYFWKVIGGMIGYFAIGTVMTTMFSVWLILILYPFYQFFLGTNGVLSLFSAVMWLWSASGFHYCLYNDGYGNKQDLAYSWDKVLWKWEYTPKPYRVCEEKVKEPSLLLQYLKAKKNKVCPILEIE